jgi:hypothetical protein
MGCYGTGTSSYLCRVAGSGTSFRNDYMDTYKLYRYIYTCIIYIFTGISLDKKQCATMNIEYIQYSKFQIEHSYFEIIDLPTVSFSLL